MFKMQIGIDERETLKDGLKAKYVYGAIDDLFKKVKAIIQELPNGERLYISNPEKEEYALADFFNIESGLKKDEDFARYCNHWLWYEDDEGEELIYDLIEMEKGYNNPLFKNK